MPPASIRFPFLILKAVRYSGDKSESGNFHGRVRRIVKNEQDNIAIKLNGAVSLGDSIAPPDFYDLHISGDTQKEVEWNRWVKSYLYPAFVKLRVQDLLEVAMTFETEHQDAFFFFLAFLNKHGLSTDYYEGRRPGAAAFVKGLLRALVYAVTLRIAKASEEDVHFRVEALRVVNEHVVSILLSLRSLVPDVTRDIMDAVTHATFLKRAAEGAEPDASLDNWIRIRSYDARNVNILHILSGIGGIAFTS